ncbi:MAG TPA: hypothetical protein ENH29_08245 [Bacteroidetes bacterium]|nr:hypothetical protein [Bacteroidota bacterium]
MNGLQKTIFLLPLSFLVPVSILSMMSCTKNPVAGDAIIAPDIRQISGRVVLNDESTPDSVFIWLEGFDLNTRSDKDGQFTLALPLGSETVAQKLSGIYHLYFYVANYYWESAIVIVNNGILLLSRGDVDEKGRLKHKIKLIKILEMKAKTEPDTITEKYNGIVNVHVSLTALEEPVIVKFPKISGQALAGAILRNDEGEMFFIENSGATERSVIVKDEVSEWDLPIFYKPGIVPIGDYEIVPYILIWQYGIPEGLLKSIGEDAEGFGPAYLGIPFKRQVGRLTILPEPDQRM